eukprot:c9245_g1_i2.p1 GENE.c9245_g1_i2~~c9245_g1_i2.p1  ORF type:complete len:716 (-),score=147.61 c9245_g1_i2:1752-3899(-)
MSILQVVIAICCVCHFVHSKDPTTHPTPTPPTPPPTLPSQQPDSDTSFLPFNQQVGPHLDILLNFQLATNSVFTLNETAEFVNTSMIQFRELATNLRAAGILPACPTLSAHKQITELLCPCALSYLGKPLYNVEFPNKTVSNYIPGFRMDLNQTYAACFLSINEICGICPSGMQCLGDLSEDLGLCVPCTLGSFCDLGSANPIFYSQANKCSAGYFSETPSERQDCPQGSYCPEGSLDPLTCNIPNRDQGYFCGPLSITPSSQCPAGSYCPDTSTQLGCEKGYYCIAGSASGQKCPFMSFCSAGTAAPPVSVAGFLFAVIFCAIVTLPMFIVTKKWQNAQNEHAIASETQQAYNTVTAKLRIAVLNYPAQQFKFSGFRAKSMRYNLRFDKLRLTLPNGKKILENVTGQFPGGSLNAIMGPSGCGKTSLLNVLTCKAGYGIVDGEVTVNSSRVSPAAYKRIMGFVPQDDLVFSDLTVRENLRFSALLRLPPENSIRKLDQVVADVIAILQLTHVQNTIVGDVEKRGISGGQRKRVNIGLELVADPGLLFLDEPTTGLDSSSSEDIIASLKQISARLGWTTVMVIHQPRFSIFELFDQVLFLGVGGRTVFLGSPTSATGYFLRLGFACPLAENPADFFMDVIAGKVERKKPSNSTTSQDDETDADAADVAGPSTSHTASDPVTIAAPNRQTPLVTSIAVFHSQLSLFELWSQVRHFC